MGVGLVVFVLLARGLGPHSYGVVATVFAYATLASLLTDFGLVSKTLRDIAAEPHNGVRLLNDSLSVKFYLTVAVTVIGLICVALLRAPGEVRVSSALIGLAVLLAAIGDHTFAAYRALGRYRLEAWVTVWTSAVHVGLVGTVALLHLRLWAVGVAFLLSRLLYMLVILAGAKRLFDNHKYRALGLRDSWLMMCGAWGWAADSGLCYLNGQMGSLVVLPLFGLYSAGIYQSGARFLQGALALIAVLTNVHIPRLAAKARLGRWPISKMEVQMFIEFTALGGAIASVLWLGGPFISHYLLGSKFKEVNALWPGFAMLVLIRYMTASLGAALTSRDVPLYRVSGEVVGLLAAVIGLWLRGAGRSLTILPWVMTMDSLAVLLVYAAFRVSLIFTSVQLDEQDLETQPIS